MLQRARYKDAEAFLRRAIAEDPANAHAHTLLAVALLHLGRETDALLEAQAAVRYAPGNPDGHYIGAIVLTEMGKYDEALSAIRTAIRIVPEMPRFHAAMGGIYMRQRKWQQALDAVEVGLRFDPQNIQCNNIRATALVKLGRQDEAEQNLESILALNPENPTIPSPTSPNSPRKASMIQATILSPPCSGFLGLFTVEPLSPARNGWSPDGARRS